MNVAEMGLLKQIWGMNKSNRIRNECIRGSLEVSNIGRTMKENDRDGLDILRDHMMTR